MPLSFQINLLNEQNNADKRQFLYLELYKLYLNSQVSCIYFKWKIYLI